MLLDILLLLFLVFAFIKGYQRGLIVGVFSFVAILVALAAAIKLSALVADYLGENVKISAQWLPVISFIIVFLAAVLLVRLGANILQRTIELGMLGWVNKLGGMIFYAALVLVVYSVLLFYATQLELITPETQEKSLTYAFVEPWAPRVVGSFGSVIPFFSDMFTDLKEFFGGVAENLSTPAPAQL
ncbi:MAG: CvpA family protein [Chitinophagaceae bacterium]|nr:CvpA family protein [Chitinophagaceae bacterium]